MPASSANTNSTQMLDSARALCRQGRFAEGIELFKQVVAAEPQNAAAHNFMGMALDRSGKSIEALPCFDRAIAADPNFADALANKADALSALGRYREAIKFYDQALGIDGTNSFSWLNRGVALFAMKEYDKALENVDKALSYDPRNPLGFINRARILAALSRYEDEAASLRNLLAIEPGHTEAMLLLGGNLLRQERAADALEQFNKALERDQNLFSALVGRGHALTTLDRPEEALESYDKAAAIHPDVAELQAGRSLALAKRDKLDDALAAIDRAIALDANVANYHNHRAAILKKIGQQDEATASTEKASALSEDNPKHQFNRGMEFLKQNDSKQAKECFLRVLKLEPNNTDAMLALSEISIEAKEYPVAIGFALHALKTKEISQTKAYFIERIVGQGHAAQNEDFRAALIKAMSEGWRSPKDLFPCAEMLIRNGPAKPLIADANKLWPQPFTDQVYLNKSLPELFADDLLVCALQVVKFDSPEQEKFLTLLRRYLLQVALTPGELVNMLEGAVTFTSALAQQCYISDFAFKVDAEEQSQVDRLIAEVKQQPLDSTQALFRIAVLACYIPLQQSIRLNDLIGISNISSFQKLIALQTTPKSQATH